METYTNPQNAQVIDISGDVRSSLATNLLQVGDTVESGAVLMLAKIVKLRLFQLMVVINVFIALVTNYRMKFLLKMYLLQEVKKFLKIQALKMLT